MPVPKRLRCLGCRYRDCGAIINCNTIYTYLYIYIDTMQTLIEKHQYINIYLSKSMPGSKLLRCLGCRYRDCGAIINCNTLYIENKKYIYIYIDNCTCLLPVHRFFKNKWPLARKPKARSFSSIIAPQLGSKGHWEREREWVSERESEWGRDARNEIGTDRRNDLERWCAGRLRWQPGQHWDKGFSSWRLSNLKADKSQQLSIPEMSGDQEPNYIPGHEATFRILVVYGKTGIGKTRIIQHLAGPKLLRHGPWLAEPSQSQNGNNGPGTIGLLTCRRHKFSDNRG